MKQVDFMFSSKFYTPAKKPNQIGELQIEAGLAPREVGVSPRPGSASTEPHVKVQGDEGLVNVTGPQRLVEELDTSIVILEQELISFECSGQQTAHSPDPVLALMEEFPTPSSSGVVETYAAANTVLGRALVRFAELDDSGVSMEGDSKRRKREGTDGWGASLKE